LSLVKRCPSLISKCKGSEKKYKGERIYKKISICAPDFLKEPQIKGINEIVSLALVIEICAILKICGRKKNETDYSDVSEKACAYDRKVN